MPPWPSGARISYWPSFVPAAKLTDHDFTSAASSESRLTLQFVDRNARLAVDRATLRWQLRPQHLALAREALVAVVREALDTGHNRCRIEMRLRDDIRLEAAGQPLVVPIGGQRVLVR